MSLEIAGALYASMPGRCEQARKRFGRPLTFTEKILVSHADDFDAQDWTRGQAMLALRPDRVVCRTSSARWRCCSSCRRGARAGRGADHDPLRPPDPGAQRARRRTCARRSARTARSTTSCARPRRKYGIGLLAAGRRHHPPGGARELRLPRRAHHRHRLAHARTRGGLGMLAVGVGGADAVEVMAGLPGRCSHPKRIAVRLTRPARRLDRAEGRDPAAVRAAHRRGRHQRDRRVHRPGRAHDQRHRQGDHRQHGRRAGRDDVGVPGRRAHGRVPARHRSRRARAPGRRAPRPARARPRGRGDPERFYDRDRRARPLRARAARRRARTRPTARGPISQLAAEVATAQGFPVELARR